MSRSKITPGNWKTFIEVYLEDYHVEPFHPGLSGFVNVADLKWEFGDWHSVQTCGVKHGLAKPGSEVYRRWHDQVMQRDDHQAPPHGAIWLTYFPALMIEWYPHVLVVSQIVPRGPKPAPTWWNSITPKTSCCSNASSSRPNRRRIAKPR